MAKLEDKMSHISTGGGASLVTMGLFLFYFILFICISSSLFFFLISNLYYNFPTTTLTLFQKYYRKCWRGKLYPGLLH